MGQRYPWGTLIVGQGVAGTLLADALVERGEPVAVADDGRAGSASRAALGLIAPLGGRRWTRAGPLEQLLPAAGEALDRLQCRTGGTFQWEAPLLRLFTSNGDRQAATARLFQPTCRPYLGPVVGPGADTGIGGVWIRGGRVVAVADMLAAARHWLVRTGRFRRSRVDPGSLRFRAGGLTWGEEAFRRVVFCQGAWAGSNPWSPPGGLAGLKGEVLEGRWPELDPRPVSLGATLVPLGQDRFRLGATYERGDGAAVPTEGGRRWLQSRLGELPGAEEARITGHKAGIRPVSADGMPLAGPHPDDHRIWLFNGLGSKGLLLGPYYAGRLADSLIGMGRVPREVDPCRFGAGR